MACFLRGTGEVMGIRLAWMAVKGLDKAALLERLGFIETGDAGEWHEVCPSFTERAGGWRVVLMEFGDLPKRAELEALSQEGEVLTCEVSETVMYSEAQGFSAGRRLWKVASDPDSKAPHGLVVEGDPPGLFEEIKARLLARQAEGAASNGSGPSVDYVFDIAPDLVYALTGFRANGPPMDEEPVMAELERIAPPKPEQRPGLLARLFGGR
jgi:hypothetical protein